MKSQSLRLCFLTGVSLKSSQAAAKSNTKVDSGSPYGQKLGFEMHYVHKVAYLQLLACYSEAS